MCLVKVSGKTHLVEHKADYQHSNQAPLAVQYSLKRAITTMLKVGFKEESTSPYASPIVLVRKKDGSNRFCIDFR